MTNAGQVRTPAPFLGLSKRFRPGMVALALALIHTALPAAPRLLDAETRLTGTGLVALNGDVAVLGDQVFARTTNGWAFQQTLVDSGSIAFDGTTLVIGSNAYTRANGPWTRLSAITNDLEVASVAVSGNTIVVGKPYEQPGTNWYGGAAYIYVRSGTNWAMQAQLVPADAAPEMFFGSAVAIDGDTVVVGAPGDYSNQYHQGAAYVFTRAGSTWAQRAKFVDPPAAASRFGGSVALSGHTVAVGSALATNSVALYTRTSTGWALAQHLSIPGGLHDFYYTTPPNLALAGDRFAALTATGAIELFAHSVTGWAPQQTITNGGGFGFAFALATNGLMVLSPDDRSAYIYEPRPWSWQTQDIGGVGLRGALSSSGTATVVTGAGADIAGTADAFRFVWRPWTGDLEISTLVTQISAADPWARGGLMLRASLDPGSPHAFMMLRAGGSTGFQARTNSGGDTTYGNGAWVNAPFWLKLVKRGSTITAYQSVNGVAWTELSHVQLDLPDTFYAGLAVTSHQTNALASVAFDRINLTSSFLPEAPTDVIAVATGQNQISLTWQDNSLTEDGFEIYRNGDPLMLVPPDTTNFTDTAAPAAVWCVYTVQAIAPGWDGPQSSPASANTLYYPTPWRSVDVGAVTPPGTDWYVANAPYQPGFEITGAGQLGGTPDAFHYLFRAWTNDFDFRANVWINRLTGAGVGVRAGLMARQSLDPASPYVMAAASENEGDKLLVRDSNGRFTTTSSGPASWVGEFRFIRRGNTILTFHTVDHALVPLGSFTTDLPATVYLGFAVAGIDGSGPADSYFSGIQMVGSELDLIAPPVLTASAVSPGRIELSWTDPNPPHAGYYVIDEWSPTNNYALSSIAYCPSNVTAFADSGLAPLTTKFYRLRFQLPDGDWLASNIAQATTLPLPIVNLPPPWQTAAIGAAGLRGSATVDENNRSFTVWGAGRPLVLYTNADAFQFTFIPWSGDGYITVCLGETSMPRTWGAPQYGLMFRQSLDPGSPYTAVYLESNGYGWRTDASCRTNLAGNSLEQLLNSNPFSYLTLSRTGSTFTAVGSWDGINWYKVASAKVPLVDPVLVGLMVASTDTNTLVYGAFGNLQFGPARPARLQAIARTGSFLSLSLQATPGYNQQIQTSTDLITWQPWTNIFSTSGSLRIQDAFDPAASQRFFRALSLP